MCLGFVALLLIVMLLTPGLRISVLLIPVWLAVLGCGYWLRERRAATRAAQAATTGGRL